MTRQLPGLLDPVLALHPAWNSIAALTLCASSGVMAAIWLKLVIPSSCSFFSITLPMPLITVRSSAPVVVAIASGLGAGAGSAGLTADGAALPPRAPRLSATNSS